MLYEYNKKIYVKPFSNKIVEVEVTKIGTEYDVKPTRRTVGLTPQIKDKLIEIPLKKAYEKQHKFAKDDINTI